MSVETYLKDVYEDTREWLKFAEAKNGFLLTLNNATLLALVRFKDQIIDSTSKSDEILFIGMITLEIISLLILIYSFKPKKVNLITNINYAHFNSTNLRFYLHLEKYSIKQLINTLSIKYDININQVDDNYLKDYISQIISLSRIATLKYKAFTFSVNIKILSFVILGFLLIF